MGTNSQLGDSYCGIYCGACDILMADKTGQKDKFASFWSESMVKAFLKSQGAARGERESLQLKCNGCKTDTLFINCKTCKVRACAVERNVSHCNDCNDFPCDIYNERKKAEGLLPHLKLCQQNLEKIKQTGVNEWLADQEKRWKCPACRTKFAWYSTKCTSCGKDLKGHTFKFSLVQSMFLKLGIRLAALKGGR